MATSTIKDTAGVEEFNCSYLISGSTCTSRGYYDKATNTVRLYAAFHKAYTSSSPVTTSTPIFGIPSEYRPSTNQTVPILAAANGNYPVTGSGTVHTNGNIYQGVTSACVDLYIATEYKL